MPRNPLPPAPLGPECAWLDFVVLGYYKRNACEGGPTSNCLVGRHHQCAHRPGGPQEHGVVQPAAVLTDRRGNCIMDQTQPFGALALWPGHVWRCTCHCHTSVDAGEAGPDVEPAGQLELF